MYTVKCETENILSHKSEKVKMSGLELITQWNYEVLKEVTTAIMASGLWSHDASVLEEPTACSLG